MNHKVYVLWSILDKYAAFIDALLWEIECNNMLTLRRVYLHFVLITITNEPKAVFVMVEIRDISTDVVHTFFEAL
jgi:hypothetical protein